MQTDTGQNACVAYCERRWPITTTTSCINIVYNTNVYGLGGLQQDHAMAVDCFNRSARLVNPWGMYNLAICFFYGWGVQPNHTAVLSLPPPPPRTPHPNPPSPVSLSACLPLPLSAHGSVGLCKHHVQGTACTEPPTSPSPILPCVTHTSTHAHTQTHRASSG